jgi:hypothetical protein
LWAEKSILETAYDEKPIPHQDFFEKTENLLKDVSTGPESFFVHKIFKLEHLLTHFYILKI